MLGAGAGTGGVPVGTADGGIHPDLPGDQSVRIGAGLRTGEDLGQIPARWHGSGTKTRNGPEEEQKPRSPDAG
ncbi:hypothetical protein GCM10023178_22910 [Actinomadura luteofluorescens]